MTPLEAKITKVDPLIKHLARERPVGAGVGKALSAAPDGRLYVDCFVEVYSPSKTEAIAGRIEELGGTVRTILTRIMTASIPLEAVEEIAGWSEVRTIEAGKPLLPKMDTARTVTNVDDVNNNTGSQLDARYDGTGVIIGIVDDTRPDYDHADFTDAGGNTRVQFYWDKNASGDGVSEISGSSGLQCTAAQIDAGTCTATAGGSANSHATHVAGIAAGDDGTYKGVAPGADIIFVFNVETDADSGGNLSTTIVDDARYVFQKAKGLKQAAVVNLSLGTSIGAHDDTSSMEKSLNELVDETPGRAIVNAAGNENFNPNDTDAARYAGLHAAIDVTSGTDEGFELEVRNASNATGLGGLGDQVIVDIWLNAASTCTVELDAFDDAAAKAFLFGMGAVAAGLTGTATNGAGTTLDVDFTDSTNANNGKRHAQATVTFASSVGDTAITDFSFDVIFRGTCTGDAWIWPDRNSTVSFTSRSPGSFGYTYVAGDSNRTTTIPGTASKIITAASFMSKQSWTDVNGTTHNQTATSGTDFADLGATGGTVSDISLFSSLGPTPDGRTKPDIAAPGEPIVSSMSANEGVATGREVTADHFKNEGTSMAAPHVSGIVALMFQKNPCLTSNKVKTLITDNAATDTFTGTTGLPDNTWGHGKIDALEIMRDIATLSGTTCGLTGATGTQDTPTTTTTGAGDGGGCFQISPSNFSLWIFLFLLTLTFRIRFTTGKEIIHATQSSGTVVEKNQTGNFGTLAKALGKRAGGLRPSVRSDRGDDPQDLFSGPVSSDPRRGDPGLARQKTFKP